MKSLITSLVIIGIFIGGWYYYYDTSIDTLNEISGGLSYSRSLVEDHKWEVAVNQVIRQQEEWNNYKKYIGFVVNRELVMEVDDRFARSLEYVKAKDDSNGTGELESLKLSLLKIIDFEKPSLSHII